MEKPFVSKVSVECEGSEIETYEYTYDSKGRMASLKKTDVLGKTSLYDLTYSYSGDYSVKISGKFYGKDSDVSISASTDSKNKTLTYQGDWSGAWKYTVGYDSSSHILSCESESTEKGAQLYSSGISYSEKYMSRNGDITREEAGTVANSKATKKNATISSVSRTTEFEYTSKEDKQNFAAYILPCEFPVWIAKGLPSNRHLIKSIKARNSYGIDSPLTYTFDYTFDSDGNLLTATRTEMNQGKTVLTRTYKFTYCE